MRRFFLWLLVFVLPLIGLADGLWFVPSDSTRWVVTFEGTDVVRGLGFADHGKIMLLAEKADKIPADIPRSHYNDVYFRAIIGLDSQTGKQLFRTNLPEEMLLRAIAFGARLSDDGSILVFCRRSKLDTSELAYHDEVLLYDWRQQQIIRRHRSVKPNIPLGYPRISGSTVIAADSGLVIWQGDQEHPFGFPNLYIDSSGTLHGLSQDGEMAHVCCQKRAGFELALIDVKKQSILQVIKGYASGVFWSSDHSSFFAVDNSTIRRFVLKENEYVPDDHFGVRTLLGSYIPARQNGPYFTVETDAKKDPWRMKLASLLGMSFAEKIWPEGKVLRLYDTVTGIPMHRVSLPNECLGYDYLPNPDGQSLGLFDGRSAALLDNYPTSRWLYPFVGLVIGVLPSIYIVRKLLRRTPRTTLPLTTLALNGAG